MNRLKDHWAIHNQYEAITELDDYHYEEEKLVYLFPCHQIENGVKKYIEVKSTSGTKEVFNMSSGEIKFMKKYKENYILILVTEVNTDFPKIKKLTCDQVLSLKQEYPSIRFYA